MRKSINEWQLIGDNEWIFGEKIRGLIRVILAEVYYDEDRDDPHGWWIWMAYKDEQTVRGVEGCLTSAVEAAEMAVSKKVARNNYDG